MKRFIFKISAFVLVVFCAGCTFFKNTADNIAEAPKIIWGSSTRALEKARRFAVSRTFSCNFQECFDAVVAMAAEPGEEMDSPEEKAKKEEKESEEQEGPFKSVDLTADQNFKIFSQNPHKKHLVIYNLPGSVNTTEVGVFFVPVNDKEVTLEISSLSTNARQTASRIIFEKLAQQYPEVTR